MRPEHSFHPSPRAIVRSPFSAEDGVGGGCVARSYSEAVGEQQFLCCDLCLSSFHSLHGSKHRSSDSHSTTFRVYHPCCPAAPEGDLQIDASGCRPRIRQDLAPHLAPIPRTCITAARREGSARLYLSNLCPRRPRHFLAGPESCGSPRQLLYGRRVCPGGVGIHLRPAVGPPVQGGPEPVTRSVRGPSDGADTALASSRYAATAAARTRQAAKWHAPLNPTAVTFRGFDGAIWRTRWASSLNSAAST